MKQSIIIFTLMISTIVISGLTGYAEQPGTVSSPAGSAVIASASGQSIDRPGQGNRALNPDEMLTIITAIDVVDLMKSGSSDADIAKLLSDKTGFDRDAALKKGYTDEQIIRIIETKPKSADTVSDPNKSTLHKLQGDNYYKTSQYDKAAKEYTLAMKYSNDTHEPYKSRADAYKQYLITKLDQDSARVSDQTKQNASKEWNHFLCNAIYDDYMEAQKINDKNISDIISELNALRKGMDKQYLDYDKDSKLMQSRYKSAQNIRRMHRFRKLSQMQSVASQANITINKALSDYMAVCREEDKIRQESSKAVTRKEE